MFYTISQIVRFRTFCVFTKSIYILSDASSNENGEDKCGGNDDKGDDVRSGIKDLLMMLQPAPGVEEKAGSEHQRGYDDIADACCIKQPETINGAQNRDQPGFEGHVVLAQAIVVNGYFQAIKRRENERNHDRTGCQGVHGLIGG